MFDITGVARSHHLYNPECDIVKRWGLKNHKDTVEYMIQTRLTYSAEYERRASEANKSGNVRARNYYTEYMRYELNMAVFLEENFLPHAM